MLSEDISPVALTCIPVPFRQSYAKRLLSSPPAQLAHELVNGRSPTDEMTFGSLVDALVFRTSLDRFAFSDHQEFRTKVAQEWRDSQGGKMIVRPATMAKASDMADSLRSIIFEELGLSIAESDVGDLVQCPLSWNEPVTPSYSFDSDWWPCQGTADIVDSDSRIIWDLKCSSVAASDFSSHAFRMGWDMQAYAYTRAIELKTAVPWRFRWLVVNPAPPFCFYVAGCAQSLLRLGEMRFASALKTWVGCHNTGVWARKHSDHVLASAPLWALRGPTDSEKEEDQCHS